MRLNTPATSPPTSYLPRSPSPRPHLYATKPRQLTARQNASNRALSSTPLEPPRTLPRARLPASPLTVTALEIPTFSLSTPRSSVFAFPVRACSPGSPLFRIVFQSIAWTLTFRRRSFSRLLLEVEPLESEFFLHLRVPQKKKKKKRQKVHFLLFSKTQSRFPNPFRS